MSPPKEVSFDGYLDIIFAAPNRLDACVNILSVFLDDIDACRDNPAESLPRIGPSILDHVTSVTTRAQQLHLEFRTTAEKRGPGFQTRELDAVLWWSGMACHKAGAAREAASEKMSQEAWGDAFFDIHALMYDSICALSLLSVAEVMMERMQAEGVDRERLN